RNGAAGPEARRFTVAEDLKWFANIRVLPKIGFFRKTLVPTPRIFMLSSTRPAGATRTDKTDISFPVAAEYSALLSTPHYLQIRCWRGASHSPSLSPDLQLVWPPLVSS